MKHSHQTLQKQGAINHAAGIAAEDQIARWYLARGYEVVRRRWKHLEGEIDLILRLGDQLIFTEVKYSKTHARAMQAVSAHQQQRVMAAALSFLALTGQSMETPMRFDVACLDPMGRVAVLENAITA